MIAWKFKLWRTAGAAAALGLAACGGEGGQPGQHHDDGGGEAGEAREAAPGVDTSAASGESGEAGAVSAYAGLSGDQLIAQRLQHLKGFVLTAQAAVDAGKPDDAAILVQQGLLEVHAPAPDQFGALDLAPVQAAADANGLNRTQMTTRLRAATQAIDTAAHGLHVDHAVLAARMIDIATGLYQGVVQADFVDPIEYQHSHGAALSAREALAAGASELRGRNAGAYNDAITEIDRFVALWPSAEAPEQPTPYRDVLAQSSRVRLALSPYL
jgi:hypothetical protein